MCVIIARPGGPVCKAVRQGVQSSSKASHARAGGTPDKAGRVRWLASRGRRPVPLRLWLWLRLDDQDHDSSSRPSRAARSFTQGRMDVAGSQVEEE